jgi:hypothetical protein
VGLNSIKKGRSQNIAALFAKGVSPENSEMRLFMQNIITKVRIILIGKAVSAKIITITKKYRWKDILNGLNAGISYIKQKVKVISHHLKAAKNVVEKPSSTPTIKTIPNL